ncbi:hypothetical protein NQ318_004421 [Aromia moschata]|uniref:DUF5641 domain-containing protein n=1 Tax=Aromia moschata TaxID=1265417 RepID=A0AAV8Y662_9CUCU|nr:hypothetical protein NQ318_004421 [Aromia moschata]
MDNCITSLADHDSATRFIRESMAVPLGKHKGELTAMEHDRAEKFVFRLVQEKGFSEKEVRILNSFNPHQDVDGLLRIKSRPPTAAWWGGFWECLIGVIKRLLRRVLGRTSLNYEDLLTLVCECEAVVNARPLTYLSEDPSDSVALSPSMFSTDQAEFGLPDYDAIDNVSLCRKYLGQLKLVCDKKLGRSIGIDDLVLVGDDNHKRLNWPLGRVIEILPGKDNLIRVVKVVTSQGHLLRPVQKLFPLECCTAPEFGYEKEIRPEGVPEEADPDPDDGARGDSAGSVCAQHTFPHEIGIPPRRREFRDIRKDRSVAWVYRVSSPAL